MEINRAKKKAKRKFNVGERGNLILKIFTIIGCIGFWILKIYWLAIPFTILVLIDIYNFIRFWKEIGRGWGDDKD